jgi:tRNA (cmo5U34)-methyltransferase
MSEHGAATTAAFGAHAEHYDAQRRRLIPPFDAFYGNAVDALRVIPGGPKRVLDLGAGTGMLSAYVAEAFPDAELTLVDGSPDMLDQARTLLGDDVTTVVADLADPLPAGPYCAVVSALAIHHLDDDLKQALFARAFDALAPGGLFVNAEQIAAPTPWLAERFAAWHEGSARAAGSSDEEWAAAEQRMRFDRLSPLEPQLTWLREAGFDDVTTLMQDHCFAVIFGRRPAAV